VVAKIRFFSSPSKLFSVHADNLITYRATYLLTFFFLKLVHSAYESVQVRRGTQIFDTLYWNPKSENFDGRTSTLS